MELQPKHLAPYLPFNLLMQVKGTSKVGVLKSIDLSDGFKVGLQIDKELQTFPANECLPILKVVWEIRDYHITDKVSLLESIRDIYTKDGGMLQVVDFHNIGGFTMYGLLTSVIETSMPYWAYEEILARHFDIFNLLEAGLAVQDELPF